jgi:hypothetical protein
MRILFEIIGIIFLVLASISYGASLTQKKTKGNIDLKVLRIDYDFERKYPIHIDMG